MPLLVIGLLLFCIPHLLRETGLRDRVIVKLPSEAAYKGTFSLATAFGLGLIVLGKSQATFFMVWQPPFEWRVVSHFLMLPGIILVIAGNISLSPRCRNPQSHAFGGWNLGACASLVKWRSRFDSAIRQLRAMEHAKVCYDVGNCEACLARPGYCLGCNRDSAWIALVRPGGPVSWTTVWRGIELCLSQFRDYCRSERGNLPDHTAGQCNGEA